MDHIWTVICEKSITDSRSNNISLINIMEQIRVAPKEDIRGILLELEVVSLWCRSDADQPETGHTRTILCSPIGDELAQSELITIDLTKYQRIRASWKFIGLPYSDDGRYHFVVQRQIDDQWQTVATVPLEIIRDLPEE